MQHQHEYKVSGVSVLFPCKPYPSQFSMMDKIIKGIERRQNCLIESPTGSGKSLALLCSTLAWQLAERAKQDLAEAEEQEKSVCTCSHDKDSVTCPKTPNSRTDTASEKQLVDLSNTTLVTDLPESDFPHDDDEDDFKSAGRNFKQLSKTKDRKKHVSIAYESDQEVSTPAANRKLDNAAVCEQQSDKTESPSSACTCDANKTERKPKTKIPKIYFGTRTHKQVAQIVRELKKTGYHDVRMSILGSREHTCIHPQVSRARNKTEACKELLNDQGCHFKDCTPRLTSQSVIKSLGLSTAWDLEDLVSFCKTKKACAYFLSRGLKDDSDLIICPYNYLVDPMVREAMQISLKGHIVILDEAHNIEDSAREAASQSLTQDNILKAIKDIESLIEANVNLADHSKLRIVLKNLDTFIDTNKTKLEQKDWDKSYKVWTGFQLVAQLEVMGLGPKLFPDYKKTLAAVRADAEQQKEESFKSRRDQDIMEMKPSTLTILEQVFQVLDYLYRFDLKYVDDYRASLFQSQSYIPATTYDGQWLNSKSSNGGRMNVQVETYTLNFWCMNPGVVCAEVTVSSNKSPATGAIQAFSDFSETRSIILTSGTLSPLTSFESELGLEFKIQLEANHVITDSQVWVGTLGQGPSGSTLQAVFRNLETFAFQDELGNLVLRVCQVVPHGVLCFLPSYNVLDKLMNRWQSTGLKNKLDQLKLVIREPKNSDKINFDDQLKMFYEAMTPQHDNLVKADTDGAVFFAVCRGKVSEGLDFADNYARAVITVGVPYPNYKDVQVELKRKYNDQHHQARGLLPGHEWYEVQAFRALNQALGRCIRHRHDWGALIIVDDRFVKTASKYCKGLSKWVRNKIQTFRDFGVAMESLSNFTAGQLALKDNIDRSLSFDQHLQTPQNKGSSILTCQQGAMSPDVTKPQQVFSIFSLGSSLRTTPKAGISRSKSIDSRFLVSDELGSHQEDYHLSNSPGRLHIPALSAKVQRICPTNIRSLGVKNSRPVHSSWKVLQTAADVKITNDSSDSSLLNMELELSLDLKAKRDHELSSFLVKEPSSFNCETEKLSVSLTDKSYSDIHLQDSVATNLNITAVPGKSTNTGQGQQITEVDLHPAKGHAQSHTTKFCNDDLNSSACISQNAGGGILTQPLKITQISAQLPDDSLPYFPVAPACKNSSSAVHLLKKTTTTILTCDKDVSVQDQEVTLTSQHIPVTQVDTQRITVLPQCATREANSHLTSEHTHPSMLSSDAGSSTMPQTDNPPEILPGIHQTSPHLENSYKKATDQTFSKKKFIFKKTPSKSTKTSVPVASDKSTTDTNCSVETSLHFWGFSSQRRATGCTSPPVVPGDSSQENGDKLVVRRKVRGTKRKHLSRSICEERQNEEQDKNCQRQTGKIVLTCTACGHILTDSVQQSEFQEQRSVPSFLKDAGKIDLAGSLFFPGQTDLSDLQGITECKTGLSTKYVEQEEICVQFLYCEKCMTTSTLAPTAVGAQVKLAAGSGARFSRGQIWLFLSAVRQTKS